MVPVNEVADAAVPDAADAADEQDPLRQAAVPPTPAIRETNVQLKAGDKCVPYYGTIQE